ncbi:MAG: hypothetical protein EBS98_04535 [Chitinophagia bacterium]|jgi:hypothetical protein|nr:hypothetical protein [Chitinophagia bacterium]
MKKSSILFNFFIILSFVFTSHLSQAQNIIQTQKILEEEKPILFGGGLLLGGGSNSFQLGLNPELLKNYNKYVDAGLIANIYYSSFNLSFGSNEKIKNFQLGAGVFTRVWPIEQFFIQIQPEYNRTWTSANNYTNGVKASTSFGATSILGGIGYGKHNADGMSYFSVMIDLLNANQSPYKIGQTRAQPIIRAGAVFPIFRKKKKAD